MQASDTRCTKPKGLNAGDRFGKSTRFTFVDNLGVVQDWQQVRLILRKVQDEVRSENFWCPVLTAADQATTSDIKSYGCGPRGFMVDLRVAVISAQRCFDRIVESVRRLGMEVGHPFCIEEVNWCQNQPRRLTDEGAK